MTEEVFSIQQTNSAKDQRSFSLASPSSFHQKERDTRICKQKFTGTGFDGIDATTMVK